MSPKGSLLLHAVVLFAAQVLLHLSLAKFFFLVFVSTGADKMVVPLCWITALFYPSCLFFFVGESFLPDLPKSKSESVEICLSVVKLNYLLLGAKTWPLLPNEDRLGWS